MAIRLVQKTVRHHQYWYLVESRRVNGQPRVVWQRYLGKAEDLAARLSAVRETEVYEFGAVAAVLAVATRLDLEGIVNRHAKKRQPGLPVGRAILLAAINRVVAPKSKAQIGTWYDKTVLRHLWGTPQTAFTSQAFWAAMDHLDATALATIEEDLARAALAHFGVRVTALAYDGTNFATDLDTDTPSELAQRGHNKQKRHDLRQVSLALLTTADGHVPLLHDTYAGNVPDPTEFGHVLGRLQARLQSLAADPRITVVFDKGNPSAANFAQLVAPPQGFSFVSALSWHRHPDLAAVDLAQFYAVDPGRWPGLLAYRTEKVVDGVRRRVVVTYNPQLAAGQLRGIRRQQAKIDHGLQELTTRLAEEAAGTRKRRTTRMAAERYVQRLIAHREAGRLLAWQVQQADGEPVRVTAHWDAEKLADREAHHLGRTVLFTDQGDWDDAAIIAAYRSQGTLENAFRQMQDPRFVTVQPLFHWTDPKIRVHIAICVMALMLASLLYREARQAGFPHGFDALMETLQQMRAVVDLPRAGSRERLQIRVTRRTADQEALYQRLGLAPFDPTTAH
ncbi:MAG: IS1634 family transposase [Thermaerobacter sp.]|nr:IS1634 family transposase [Thermaerobacter sp.]